METRLLSCPLTEQELLERGQKMAQFVREHGSIEDEKKNAASEFKAKLDQLDQQIRNIAVEVRNKAEMRQVEVKREKDFMRDVEETVRVDTGEVIETRPLTPGERQMRLGEGAN